MTKEIKPDNSLKEKTKKEQPTNLYHKLQLVQKEVGELIRTEENKFQKYKFFNELQVLHLLKPLLDKYQLTILLSDDTSQPLIHERDGKEHFIKYLKRLEIVDCEAPTNKLLFNFWACGSNVDLAKAKGSSETYAIKYLLSKFFLMPAKDEMDPDYQPQEEKVYPDPIKYVRPTITSQQSQALYDLMTQKRGANVQIQNAFFSEVNQIMKRAGVAGETNANNLKMRLTTLTPLDFQYLWNWLMRLPETK